MYLARFELDGSAFRVAAVELDARPDAPLLPDVWLPALVDRGRADLALRLTRGAGGMKALLLVLPDAGDVGTEDLLRTLGQESRSGARIAGSPEEFDRVTGGVPPHQARLNQRGYTVRGEPVATDFRLLPLLDWLLGRPGSETEGLCYQINLRRHRPEPEDRRAARKYGAALEVDSPFPEPVVALERTIAARLLEPGFRCDELVGAPSAAALKGVLGAVAEHFEATMGPFGFTAAPLDVGRFDEMFLTGRHSSWFDPPAHLLWRAAEVLPLEDVRRLLAAPPPAAAVTAQRAGKPGEAMPAVFLSYSSRDVVQALATCRFLESEGIGCWMAPRNIQPGEAYPDAIMRGLEGCRALVVLLSDASNLSPHVHREIERALKRQAVIIPVRLQEIEPSGAMEYLLSTCQRLDGFGPRFEDALGLLARRLRAVLAAERPGAAR